MDMHPLTQYLDATRRSVADLAASAGVSRMTIYRLVRGDQNATVGVMSRVSEATGGAVSVAELLPKAHRPQADPAHEAAS